MKATKKQKREHRHKRVRAKIFGTTAKPRLSVFKSNNDMYLQLIDDSRGLTLAGLSANKLGGKGTKTEYSFKAGEKIASMAKEKGIEAVVFDRGGYRYHGRIKAAAEGARLGGLKF